MSNFLPSKESDILIQTISRIEKSTIGEIRIHMEDLCEQSPYERALDVFHRLGMQKTDSRSGILIYIATEDRKLAIVGDVGIHQKVGQSYWNGIISEMKSKIQAEGVFQGLYVGLEAVGKELIKHFPENDTPRNELSNEISYGKV